MDLTRINKETNERNKTEQNRRNTLKIFNSGIIIDRKNLNITRSMRYGL